jgi:putative CocE/NonD family hydrolase
VYLTQDLKWRATQVLEKISGWFTLPFMKIGSDEEIRCSRILERKNLWIPMRDGVHLRADLYLPGSDLPTEAIVIRMPYGKREPYCWMPVIGRFWARRGYACLIQDVRGRFASEGQFVPFVNEGRDGYDTIAWIAEQPWCNGAVGIMGESYYGYTSWAAAVEGHPALKCAAPSTTSMDIYGNWVYNSGAFCLQTMGIWGITMDSRTYTNEYRLHLRHLPLTAIDSRAGTPSRIYQEWMNHPLRDDYWEERNLTRAASRIAIPCLHIGGWYDVFLRSTYEDWERLRSSAADTRARENQWLFIGPGDHEFSTDFEPTAGRMALGTQAAGKRWDLLSRFFDYWLKGLPNGFDATPRVTYFLMGHNRWRHADTWPPRGTIVQSWYLKSSGRAATDPGDGRLVGEGSQRGVQDSLGLPDHFLYDPADPVCASERIDLWHLAEHLQDRRPTERRLDVLTYTSPVLRQEVAVIGPIKVVLYASTDRRDTDFTATLVDVYSDGYAQLIQEGILRGRYLEGDRKIGLLQPGRVYRFQIDLWATAYVFAEGHAIRLEVSSSNFTRFDRNLNNGDPSAGGTTMLPARQTVYHSREYPSALVLTVSRH